MRSIDGFWAQRLQNVLAAPLLAPFVKGAKRLLGGQDREASAAGRMAVKTFLIRIAGAGLAFASQILLARWMGAHEYGIFSLAWTWVIMLGVMACGGFATSASRFIPQYRQSEDWAHLRGFLTTSRLVAFLLASLVTAVGISGVLTFQGALESYYVQPMLIVLLAIPMFAVGAVQDGIARSYDWTMLAMQPTYIWRPLTILLLLAALILLGETVTAQTAVITALVATTVIALAQYLKLAGRLKSVVPAGARETDLPTWVLVSMPMLLVEGFIQLITSADTIMVSFWHTPDEVAVYFAASKTLALVHFVYFAVRAASAHRFSGFVHSGDTEGLSAYIRQATMWTFWPSVAAACGLLLIAPFVLSLFGPGFSDGYSLIALLSLGVLARASVGPADALLSMSGYQKRSALIYGTTFILNICLNIILIPQMGLAGAALATSLAISFEATYLAISVHQRFKVHTFILPILLSGRRKT
ncbi:lipopolysaccharide biosynthesis protein [Roseibium sediminis]|uniref:lipopolysaccharide biosynthesis protein n=1 Tax=Roseibium sediminis TaxID=1775174 RepID=UPI00123CF8EB|nr:lipopolysaccharide biosynthesis protein [Roseibium sediminis]